MKPLTNLSDQQLIHLYMEGKSEALSSLVYRYKDKIYTSIYLLVKDKCLAEDIFQDSLVRVIDSLNAGRYTHEGNFLPWVIKIAHNLCMDHFRKIKRTPAIKGSDHMVTFDIVNFSDLNADQRMMQEETHCTVLEMLDRLPENQREVIILKHYVDLTFKEIASLTKCSINTALGRMHYGLLNLRKMMVEK